MNKEFEDVYEIRPCYSSYHTHNDATFQGYEVLYKGKVVSKKFKGNIFMPAEERILDFIRYHKRINS